MSLEQENLYPRFFEPYQSEIKMPGEEDEEADGYFWESFPALDRGVPVNELDINYETAYHLQSHVYKITSLARLPQGGNTLQGSMANGLYIPVFFLFYLALRLWN